MKKKIEFSPLSVTKDNRWRYRKFGIRYILSDAKNALGLDKLQINGLFKILLSRGVVETLRNRKKLFRLNCQLKGLLTIANYLINDCNNLERAKLSGYIMAIEFVRMELNDIINAEDWAAGADDYDSTEVDKLLEMDFR